MSNPDLTATAGAAAASTPPADRSLRSRAIRSSVWTVASYGAGQVLRLASNLILTRLLFPEIFGLMAIVHIFLQGLQTFSDVGIGPSIIQSRLGDQKRFLSTAWTIQIVRGGCLWVASGLLAWPVAQFYNQPILAYILPVAGLNALIDGFNSTKLWSARRHLALGRVLILNLLTQVIGLAAIVALALAWPSVWALVIGTLVGNLSNMLLSHVTLPGQRDRLHWDRECLSVLFSFGRWVFMTTALTFLSSQMDKLLLGKFLTLELFGIFSIAYLLTEVPRRLLSMLSGQVMFPALSRLAELPREKLRQKLARNRLWLLITCAAGCALLVSVGDWVVLLLYDSRYAPAGRMLPVLALGLWPRVLISTQGAALMAIGKPMYNAMGSLGKLALIVIGLPLAFSQFGVMGAVAVIACADIPNYLSVEIGLHRESLRCTAQDMGVTLLMLALLGGILAARVALGFGLPGSTIPV